MMRLYHMNKKGIALMMVISSIMLLSMVILEFVYGTTVNYKIAINDKERLQAYYLAQSAMNLMKVELKLDKQFKSMIAGSSVAQSIPIDMSQPICKQFPFSTALIRGFFIGGVLPGGEEGGTKEEGGGTKDEEGKGSGNFIQRDEAQAFLSFDGDFDGSCESEESKLNFNYFYELDPAQTVLSGANSYDIYKGLMVTFLKSERFKKLFDKPEEIDDAVKNIADWVDKNDVRNDIGNTSGGPESVIYKGDKEAKPKNTKFLSLDELHLVEGVKDKWFLPLEDNFTVYGASKINICQAPDDVVWSLILAYAAQNQSIPPIPPGNADVKKKLLDTIQFSCTSAQPQATKIAQDLDAALGIAPAGTSAFANMISTESRYYSLKLTGQVGETVVNIKVVFDTKDADPKKWKMLYYKVY